MREAMLFTVQGARVILAFALISMLQERLTIKERSTVISETTALIVSALRTTSYEADIVVGQPGLSNLSVTLNLGGAALFETPEGVFELRALSISSLDVRLLVTKISPRPGVAGGLVDQNPENTPFLPEELERIAKSIDQIKTSVSSRADVTAEQLRYLLERLDEMQEASERLGRKDWINYALGTLTSVVISAAFDRVAATALLAAAGVALSWLFGGGIRLLP